MPAELPADLPAPVDDGACDGLAQTQVPALALPATDGSVVDLARISEFGRTVVYAYPRTGRPGEALPVPDWDTIPGARGCTAEACAFRDRHAELANLGATVFGLSSQRTGEQREAAQRLRLPFRLLSDASLGFAAALGLPTFEVAGQALLRRVTLILHKGRVEHVFYPVFPPDRHPEEVADWLRGL